jgi:hypothetical protein
MNKRDDNFEDETVGLFTSLRQKGFDGAAVGLWMDILKRPLELAQLAGLADQNVNPDAGRISERNVNTCSRIVELLNDDVGRSLRSPLVGADEGEFDELRKYECSDAVDASCLADALAEECAAYLQSYRDNNGRRDNLLRMVAIIRVAFEHDPVCRDRFDPQTGEYRDPGDDEPHYEEVD